MFSVTGPVTTIPSAWRGDEGDAEAREVELHVAGGVELRLAPVAAARRDLAQAQRAAEHPAHLGVEGARQERLVPCDDELLARAHGEPVVARERDGAGGAGL